jgi:6-pyruvoyltetrahydropterin/6-carboxytetrahydropterin synthase
MLSEREFSSKPKIRGISLLTITRRIEFDSGHRVLGHEGKCRFIHGHRYALEISITAPELDKIGRVLDFGEIKNIVQGWIDSNFDHNLLLHKEDPLFDYIAEKEDRVPYLMKFGNPTAENIVKELYYQLPPLLPDNVKITKIRVYETPNCWSEEESCTQTLN